MHAERSQSNSVFSVCGISDLRVLQANVCTLHPRELMKSATKQACGSTARMITLDSMFTDADAHVVCVQEGRIQGTGSTAARTSRCSELEPLPAGLVALRYGSGMTLRGQYRQSRFCRLDSFASSSKMVPRGFTLFPAMLPLKLPRVVRIMSFGHSLK